MLKNVHSIFAGLKSNTTDKSNKNTNNKIIHNNNNNSVPELLPRVTIDQNSDLSREESLSRSQSGASVYRENVNLRQICLTFEHFRCENYHNFLRYKHQYLCNRDSPNREPRAVSAGLPATVESICEANKSRVASLSDIIDADLYFNTPGVKIHHSPTTTVGANINVRRSVTTSNIYQTSSTAPSQRLSQPDTNNYNTNTQQKFSTETTTLGQLISLRPLTLSKLSSLRNLTSSPQQTHLCHRSVSEYSFTRSEKESYPEQNIEKVSVINYNDSFPSLRPILEQNLDSRAEKMSSPEVTNTSGLSKLPSYIRLSKTISGYGACKHYNLEDHTYERAKSSSSRHSDSSDQFRSLPYDALLNQFQNSRNIDSSSPRTASPSSSSSSNFLQKKIASLYGSTFADDWQRSRSRSRLSNGSSERSPRSPSCPPSRLNESKDSTPVSKSKAMKEFSPTELLKQMKEERKQHLKENSKQTDKKQNIQHEKKPEVEQPKQQKERVEQTEQTTNGNDNIVNFVQNIVEESKKKVGIVEESMKFMEIAEDNKEFNTYVNIDKNIIEVKTEKVIQESEEFRIDSKVPEVVQKEEILKAENREEVIRDEFNVNIPTNESNKFETIANTFTETISETVSQNIYETILQPDTANLIDFDNVEESKKASESEKFLKEVDVTRTEFQIQIQRFENILVEIDSPERQDAMGKIRATIGKASLLLTKKMKQFEQLCHDSLNQTGNEEFCIKGDDLQGYWDMLYIQIEEVRSAFVELEKLQSNGWELAPDQVDTIYHSSPTSRSAQYIQSPRRLNKLGNKASPSRIPVPNSGSDSERKAKLNELKRKAKERMLANQIDKAEEEICIFAPAGPDLNPEAQQQTSGNEQSEELINFETTST